MKLKYSQAFKEQALQKVWQRGDKTIQRIGLGAVIEQRSVKLRRYDAYTLLGY